MPFIYKIYLGILGISISTGMLTTYFVSGFEPLILFIIASILLLTSCVLLFKGLWQQEIAIVNNVIVAVVPDEQDTSTDDEDEIMFTFDDDEDEDK